MARDDLVCPPPVSARLFGTLFGSIGVSPSAGATTRAQDAALQIARFRATVPIHSNDAAAFASDAGSSAAKRRGSVERQQGLPSEGDDHRLFLDRQDG
jgi:hypothetical protein